ncbi:hypothetical protein AEYBE204_19035 [Asticcacaulis sp. YBE204]|nr:hypothetical protein AEYBE204_19035 [Asticcacaulis sp. YBE204]
MLNKARRAVVRSGVASQDADDIVHDAYLRVREFELGAKVLSPEALLVTAAKNLAFNFQRRKKRGTFFIPMEDELSMADDQPSADEMILSQERFGQLATGLEHLPEKTRRILLSRRLDGKSFKDIAAAEDMTVAAVEKQVARATLELLKWVDK